MPEQPMHIRILLVLAMMPLSVAAQSVEESPAEASGEEAEPPDQEGGSELARVERMIVERVNAFRKDHGRAPVEMNSSLDDASEYFAGYMARTGKYGHEADGKKPSERAGAHGYEYCIVLENIAWAFNSAGFTPEQLTGQFVSGWENSPGHRKNMLDPDATHTGVAVARSAESGKYYAVQMFGRPRSAMIRFRISNRSNAVVEYRTGNQAYKIRPRYTRTHGACRSPSVTLPVPPDRTPATQPSANGGSTLQPRDGTRYVIRGDSREELRVEEE